MAGRPRIPDEIHELNGTWDHNPARRRTSPKSPRGIGQPPEHLTEIERKIWFELIEIAAPDVLVSSDRLTLARLCQLESKVRAGTVNGWESQLHFRLLTSIGFIPADRSRIASTRTDDNDNPFAAFVVAKAH
jgi:hypothetical protein